MAGELLRRNWRKKWKGGEPAQATADRAPALRIESVTAERALEPTEIDIDVPDETTRVRARRPRVRARLPGRRPRVVPDPASRLGARGSHEREAAEAIRRDDAAAPPIGSPDARTGRGLLRGLVGRRLPARRGHRRRDPGPDAVQGHLRGDPPGRPAGVHRQPRRGAAAARRPLLGANHAAGLLLRPSPVVPERGIGGPTASSAARHPSGPTHPRR